jgi:hypothetical protein
MAIRLESSDGQVEDWTVLRGAKELKERVGKQLYEAKRPYLKQAS